MPVMSSPSAAAEVTPGFIRNPSNAASHRANHSDSRLALNQRFARAPDATSSSARGESYWSAATMSSEKMTPVSA